ncbi:MAG: PAS domain-containing protein [Proteobacteria bacterium]|nr:PAS domain-containing protein [Pseudomonadota bacterium]
MSATVPFGRHRGKVEIDPLAILHALRHPVIVVDAAGRLSAANPAAEQFFELGASHLIGRMLNHLIPADSPVFALIEQVCASGASISEYGVTLETPRIGTHLVTVEVAPLAEAPDTVVLSIHERSMAHKIDRQLTHRNAARSVTAMAAMLAHEVKNPLSGIRGAAQLLEQSGKPEDRELTRLICDETDRICALVDRMEAFSDPRPLKREAVNIHQVIEHARKVAENGFAQRVHFIERYDPSLPPVHGNRDMLIQVFLNLIKNAAEAVPEQSGEIVLSTTYQQGVRLAVPGASTRLHLPLVATVQDNGAGIPEDLRTHLFDAFVTTKVNGTGLGLALVAKIIGDHGGVVEFDSQPRRTIFRVLLPVHAKGHSE